MKEAISIANYFVKKSLEDGCSLTPMKLVKLVYISHGWYLGLTEEPLLTEAVQAWRYGPVVPSVYHSFKKYYNFQITSLAVNGISKNDPLIVKDKEITKFLDKIWEVYKNYTGLQLSTLTHQEGTPWYVTWSSEGKNSRDVPIPNQLIRDYYIKKVNGSVNYA